MYGSYISEVDNDQLSTFILLNFRSEKSVVNSCQHHFGLPEHVTLNVATIVGSPLCPLKFRIPNLWSSKLIQKKISCCRTQPVGGLSSVAGSDGDIRSFLSEIEDLEKTYLLCMLKWCCFSRSGFQFFFLIERITSISFRDKMV